MENDTRVPVSIEQMETRWIAYVDGLPGCFFSAEDRDEALLGVPGALWAYLYWLDGHNHPLPGIDHRRTLYIAETVPEWIHPLTGEAVNAFFAADAPALSGEEVTRAACMFEWTAADLLHAFADLPQAVLAKEVEREWSIQGIVYHTARADWAYLRALGLAPDWSLAPVSAGLPALLGWTTHLMLGVLPGLVGSTCIDLVSGELWSPRKFVRRALWHRRDHLNHIQQFRRKLGV
jgi:predicted RNase H-like HicB family nuclease